MNRNTNTYTLLYAAIIVVVAATALAFVSEALKPIQRSNIETEKRLNILSSARLAADVAKSPNKNDYVANLFQKYITDSYMIDYKGVKVDGNAFTIDMKQQYDLLKEIASSSSAQSAANAREKLRLPVFECTLENGNLLYVVQCYGQGLWGPIWGYISLQDDCNTIYGAVFDHKGETPGLGAEIATAKYAAQFTGKTLFEKGQFVSISVVKGGARAGDSHAVDAISGGTITSNALQSTLFSSLEVYLPFFHLKTKQ
jgi:Na+-transporting NADH:ubiquinone oxidoreductase subunit C